MYFLVLVVCSCFSSIQAQAQQLTSISKELDQFALRLLAQTNRVAGDKLNVALSPYTVWTLLTIISEGAGNNTLTELENVLGVPKINKDIFRNDFIKFAKNLDIGDPKVSLRITNTIFLTNEYALNNKFKTISENVYNVDVIPTNFHDSNGAVQSINSHIARATQNEIPNLVNPSDIQDATIFMTSTLYFKGQWRHPFNKTATHSQPFYNDFGQPIGKVEMMYETGPFPYILIMDLKSHAVQLPYGDSNKYSMIVLVPRKDVTLDTVLSLAANMPFTKILDNLATVEQDFSDEEVEVFLPKFRISSEINLDGVLKEIGIRDVFSAERADLLGIFPQYLYISRILQKAVIDVDEEGTVAASSTGASFAYKMTKPKLVANKPFAFFIVNNESKGIVFAGKVTNPNGICDRCIKT